jgi:hypothetical protein
MAVVSSVLPSAVAPKTLASKNAWTEFVCPEPLAAAELLADLPPIVVPAIPMLASFSKARREAYPVDIKPSAETLTSSRVNLLAKFDKDYTVVPPPSKLERRIKMVWS